MNVNELIKKMKKDGVKSLTDSEIESVDFTKTTAEDDKELADMVKIIHDSKVMKSMDSLMNTACRKFIKECRDISAAAKK